MNIERNFRGYISVGRTSARYASAKGPDTS